MSKNRKSIKADRKNKRELRAIRSARSCRPLRSTLGATTETAEPEIFFFSLGGMVMPLSMQG